MKLRNAQVGTRRTHTHTAVGIGVSVDAVRAVCVRSGRVVWARELECPDADNLEATLDALLLAVPRGFRRTRVGVAIGPARSQLRLVRGLPELEDRALVSALVQQDPARFFLRNGTPIVTTSVHVVDNGSWVGAIDQPVVDAVRRACRRKRGRHIIIVPTAAVLHLALDEERVDWRDGEVSVSVQRAGARLQSCRRSVGAIVTGTPIRERRIAAAAPRFDGDTFRFADAIAAAQLERRSTLAVPSHRRDGRVDSLPRWRIPLASLSFFAATMLALAAPGIEAARALRHLRAERAKLEKPSTAAMRLERELGRHAALLREFTEFDRSSRSMTLSLAALTRAIRPPSMLLGLRADSTGGTLVALTPSAAALVTMLGNDTELSAPRIVGPVTPQAAPVGPTPSSQVAPTATSPSAVPPRTERVTIHFVWRGAAP